MIRGLPSPVIAGCAAIISILIALILIKRFDFSVAHGRKHIPFFVGIVSFTLMQWVAANYIVKATPEQIAIALEKKYAIFSVIFEEFENSRPDFLIQIADIQDVSISEDVFWGHVNSLSISTIDKYFFQSVPKASEESILNMLKTSRDINERLRDQPLSCMAFEIANPSQALKILPPDIIQQQLDAKAQVIKSARGQPSYPYIINKEELYDMLVFQFNRSGGTEDLLINASNLSSLPPPQICETSKAFYDTFLRMPPDIAILLYKNLNMP